MAISNSRASLLPRRLVRALKAIALKVRGAIAERELAHRQLTVRELAESEHERVRAGFQGSNSPSQADIARQSTGETGIVVAWMDSEPLGLGFVHWPGPRNALLAERWPGTPEIYRLHVLPRYRSLGVGGLLIRHIEQLAAAKGVARVGLGVHSHNERAHALYVRLGYAADAVQYLDEFEELSIDGSPRLVSEAAIFLVKSVGKQ